MGFLGIIAILLLSVAISNNRKAINVRLVVVGLLMQWILAFFILKTKIGQTIFQLVGDFITKLLAFSMDGSKFVFGVLASKSDLESVGIKNSTIFAFTIAPTIILVCAIVMILYHLGIMQKVVSFVAKIVFKLMQVSGAEAVSNVASVFVGQVEAQIMIKPYLKGMTMSELLASMTGSMACIAGGIMAVYISMGISANYLLAASIMAAPGALVISKIVWPETEVSETKGEVKVHIEKTDCNIIDAAAHGCSVGMKVSLNVLAMLIGFLALIAMLNWFLGEVGSSLQFYGLRTIDLGYISFKSTELSIQNILAILFAPLAYLMGVPGNEISTVGSLLGTKVVANEFVAYSDLSAIIKGSSAAALSHKSVIISTFALCGFANLGSVAIQIGGIGELEPSRKHDLAQLGIKALICGSLASYMSATIAGLIAG